MPASGVVPPERVFHLAGRPTCGIYRGVDGMVITGVYKNMVRGEYWCTNERC